MSASKRRTALLFCSFFLISSCGVSHQEESLSELPSNFLEVSAACSIACVSERKALVDAQISSLIRRRIINGVVSGAAAGCSLAILLGDSEDCARGAAAGAIVGGVVGNQVGQRAAEAQRAELFERETLNEVKIATSKVRTARAAFRSSSARRSAALSSDSSIIASEVEAYHTDLALTAVTLTRLQSVSDELSAFVEIEDEKLDWVSFARLKKSAAEFSRLIDTFGAEFRLEERTFKKIVVANGCAVSAETDDEEGYTFIPLPSCAN